MTNGNDAAFQNQTFSPNSDAGFRESEALTKREYFAAMAMQGMLSDSRQADLIANGPIGLPQLATMCADALIDALNK